MERLANNDAATREVAAGALRQTGDKRAIPLLKKALQDASADVVTQASMSLQWLERA